MNEVAFSRSSPVLRGAVTSPVPLRRQPHARLVAVGELDARPVADPEPHAINATVGDELDAGLLQRRT
jgi:hypothetical protein